MYPESVIGASSFVLEGYIEGTEYAIDAFFDGVMVMDENEAIRENRLRLLNRFVAVFKDVADFGKMAKK